MNSQATVSAARPAPPSATLEPLPMRSAGERIAERFVTAIALGEFVPGQRLPTVRELAATLEVGRSTVREAIGRLAATGYVTVQRGRTGGTFVTADWGAQSTELIGRTLLPQWERLEQLLDYRALIEQQIARTAAQRRLPADLAAIKSALRAYERAGSDRESSRAADLAVHQAIAGCTRNPHLVALSLRIRHEVSFGFDAEPYDPQLRARALAQHPLLAEAIINQDADLAAALAAAHFSLTEGRLRELHDRISARPDPPSGQQKRRPHADHNG